MLAQTWCKQGGGMLTLCRLLEVLGLDLYKFLAVEGILFCMYFWEPRPALVEHSY